MSWGSKGQQIYLQAYTYTLEYLTTLSNTGIKDLLEKHYYMYSSSCSPMKQCPWNRFS